MQSLFFSKAHLKKLTELKQLNYRLLPTTSSFTVAEAAVPFGDYVHFFQESLQESLHFQLLNQLLQEPFSTNKDLCEKIFVSESTYLRKIKELGNQLNKYCLLTNDLRQPSSKLAEIQRRTMLIPVMALDLLDLPSEEAIEQTLFSLLLEEKQKWNSSLNRFMYESLHHPASLFFQSESNYIYLWKLILGIEHYPVDSQFSRYLASHMKKKNLFHFSLSEQRELGRLFLFFFAIYPCGIPDCFYDLICKRYKNIKKHYSPAIDQYSLLLTFFLFP
ncbi:helix-turn-helix domain-containing protein [Enterococcus italicus]|uniref:helix-turn-helix domain-containing protein n=1 Tax=Enterococcus italicus TaxID=246144 RepID=UPI0020734D23|nr:helix-turn-helix domain-containing protein [Enterococcus italicus]MCM6880030.1 helix-turn-helix domain-containing protein [Enterococcus italicus]